METNQLETGQTRENDEAAVLSRRKFLATLSIGLYSYHRLHPVATGREVPRNLAGCGTSGQF